MNWLKKYCGNREDVAEYLLAIGITLYFDQELVCALLALLVAGKTRYLLFVNWKFVILFSLISVYSLLVTMWNGYEQDKTFQQMLLVGVFFQIYYSVFKAFRGNLESVFRKYLQVSLFMAMYAICMYILGTSRVNAWQIEPSYFAMVLIPATAYYVLYEPFNSWKTIIIVCANLLSFSTASVMIMSLLFFYKFMRFKNVIYQFLFISLSALLTFSTVTLQSLDNASASDVAMKMEDSFEAFSEFNIDYFETLNLSTYALFSNIYVALNAPTRLFGTGLGTHDYSYDLVYQWSGYQYWGQNKMDAYSLLIRIFSEFGYLGAGVLLLCFVRFLNTQNKMNIAALFFLIYAILRGGHYVLYGTVFYFYMYYYTSKKNEITSDQCSSE